MILFPKINWNNIRNIISDMELIAKNYKSNDAKDDIEITNLIYQVEKEFFVIKKALSLPSINSGFSSASVITSFHGTPKTKNVFKEPHIYNNYFRENDYQYWLLIFLLMKNNEIREKKLSLFEIIDIFIDRIKEDSFTWRDIENTGSGATRCRTNLRFAYDDLKKVGLVYLHDKKHKNSWTLTFLGFFLAASFCLFPMDKNKQPLSRRIMRFYQSTYYYRINRCIWDRIHKLSNAEYFQNIVSILALDDLGLPHLINGPQIFKNYYGFIFGLDKIKDKKKVKNKALANYLEELNSDILANYMSELSVKFNAEAFLTDIINSYKV